MKPRSLADVTGVGVATLGWLVLAGWALDIAALKSILPGWVSMKPNTALAFVLTGLALWLQRNAEPSTLARSCAVLAGLIGLLTLGEYVFDWNPGIDQWLFREPSGAPGTSHPGRMAPDTALCFVLLAATLTIARGSRATKKTLAASAILGSLVTAVALAAILAYFAPALRTAGWWSLTIMAPPTAVLFAVLGGAVVLGSWRDALSPKLTRFSSHLWWLLGCAFALTIAFALYARSEQQHARAGELRHRSFLLADELRHSGDDLTRMARTYVVTGDPVYKQHFQDILDIRDGKKPRPEDYARPYWDLVLGDGRPPRASQQTIALLELMRQAGFSEEEFGKLAEAKANSDGLTIPEFEAMKLVESTGPEAEADRARARVMMHDARYHQAKAAVMGPIHDFFVLVDKRTLAAVQAAENSATVFRYAFAACGLGLMLALWRTYVALGDTLGGSVDEVHAQIARIGSGDFSAGIQIKVNDGLDSSVLGWLSETQAKLKDIDRERKRAEAVQSRLAAIVDSSADAIIGKTLTGMVTSWNAGAERLFGYSAEEMIGQPVTRLFPGDRLEEEARLLSQIGRGERVEGFDTVRVRKDGRQIEVSLTLSPIKDTEGHVVGASKIARDISERKQAADALARRELARFNTAAVGRELRMIELKQQVNELARQLGQPQPYALESLDEAGSHA